VPAFVVMVVVYPFFGAAMGWVMGALGSFTYNLVVRMTGGMVLQLDSRDPRGEGPFNG
jgi:ABC-type dipeptide/oligopeptide/nickel transport system permease subunit